MTAVYEDLAGVLATAMIPTADLVAAAMPGTDAEVLINLSLAIEVISGVFSWTADGYDTPVLRFHNITPAAQPPPGLDLGPDGGQSNWPTKKLYGERLGHFGAFISPEGRRHDWLWGRLDGASELSNQMLDTAKVPEEIALPLRTALIAEILAAEEKTSADIAADVTVVYKADTPAMIARMAASDDGKSFRQLESTVWALSRQWGTPAAWLRALLAPQWSITDEGGVPLKQRALMQAARTLIALPRRYLRSKLPYRQQD
jgi:hypothetical protein